MKKRIKKLMAVLCAVTLTASMGSVCLAAEGEANGKVLSKEEALNPEEPIELTVWNIATQADAYYSAWVEAVEEFEKTYPNIQLNVETFENESYKTKVKTAAAGNELPDIFYSFQGGFSKTFADAGKIADLTPYYENFKDELPENTLTGVTYQDAVYGTGMAKQYTLLFYNKKMFDERGLEAPATWDEFKEICQTFVDEGIAPLTISAKETWVLACLHDCLAVQTVGNEKAVNTLNKNGSSYDEDFLFAAEQIKELVDMGAFVEGASALTYLEANNLFLNGDAPMIVTLSGFNDPFLKTDHPDDFDVTAFPTVGDKAKATDLVGGCADTLLVSADSEHVDQAAYAAFELSKMIGNAAYSQGIGYSAWTTAAKRDDLMDYQKKIEEILDSATSFCLNWNCILEGDDATEYESLLEQLFIGDITPEDFVAAMDAQLAS